MLTFTKHIRVVGLLAMLFLLAGSITAWAQTSAGIKISGKACVPDQECKADSLTFTDSVRTGVTSRVWNFGDNTTVTKQRDSTAKHVYQQAGTYTVVLTRTVNGTAQTANYRITINNRPSVFFELAKRIPPFVRVKKITLDPYAGSTQSGYRYLWYPKGDTTQSIQVDSSGCYSVEAISPNGCSYQDRINVDVCGEKKESQGVKWYFGQNAGLDFSGGGTPKPITDGKLSTIEGSSSIANTKGILLFYSDGITIYDKKRYTHEVARAGRYAGDAEAVGWQYTLNAIGPDRTEAHVPGVRIPVLRVYNLRNTWAKRH